MTKSPDLQQYLDALKRGYAVLSDVTARATGLGSTIPQRLANEIRMGQYEVQELAGALADDPTSMLSGPYAPLTEAAVASQSRSLAFVELAYREAMGATGGPPEVAEQLAAANRAAADAAAELSRSWASLWELVGQASAQPHGPSPLPREVTLGDLRITLRAVAPADGPLILRFARTLPPHDLLFLRRDITQPDQVSAWLRDSVQGLSDTILALHNGELVGYATVASDGLNWTRHVGELRVLVGPTMRGKRLGRLLTEQAFAVAKQRGVRKMIAQMTTDQEAAIAIFQGLGFEPEARLRNHVMDRDGQLHDLQIMSLDVKDFQAKLEAAIAEPPA